MCYCDTDFKFSHTVLLSAVTYWWHTVWIMFELKLTALAFSKCFERNSLTCSTDVGQLLCRWNVSLAVWSWRETLKRWNPTFSQEGVGHPGRNISPPVHFVPAWREFPHVCSSFLTMFVALWHSSVLGVCCLYNLTISLCMIRLIRCDTITFVLLKPPNMDSTPRNTEVTFAIKDITPLHSWHDDRKQLLWVM